MDSKDLTGTYEFEHPVTLGERKITCVTFARPQVRHFVRADGLDVNSVAADRALFSALTGEPESLCDRIDIDDWAKIRLHLARIWYRFLGIEVKENPTKQAVAIPKEQIPTA